MNKIYTEIVNSKNRIPSSISSTDFTVKLSKPFNNIKKIILKGYVISNTIYTINNNNNVLSWIEDVALNPDVSITTTLTLKNYTATQLATEIASKMTNASLLNGYSLTYLCTYDNQTMKFTISINTPAIGDRFYFNFNNVNNNCSTEIGFPYNYVGSYDTTITSPNIIRLDKNFILMETDLLNDIKTGNEGFGSCSFVLPLPPNATTEYYFTEVYTHLLEKHFSTFNSISIRLKDFENRIVNMNGSDHIFIFEFIE